MGLADIITQDLERMLNKIAEEQTKENKMMNRDEALKSCFDQAYRNIRECEGELNTHIRVIITKQLITIDHHGWAVKERYTTPKPCPKAGTPMLGWNDDKARAVVGVATGSVAPREDGSRLIEMRVGNADHLVGNWSILKEVEE